MLKEKLKINIIKSYPWHDWAHDITDSGLVVDN